MSIRLHASLWLLVLGLVITAAIYWSGLNGPIVFDDYWNLAPISRWHAGQQGWQSALLPNSDSFVYSRPVAMASFMLTTWLGGDSTFGLKLGNLIVHLLCGLMGFAMLRKAFHNDHLLLNWASGAAAIATIYWLIHPLHVSTVLYGVQRMAQLSTLFSLACVVAYIYAREQIIRGNQFRGIVGLWLAFPCFFALGVLSKQNSAIAGCLCLVMEMAYFNGRGSNRRNLLLFFSVFVGLPIVATILILVFAPHRLLIGYVDLEFGMFERLLTQPRALFDYIGMWFLPRGPRMGLYTDDFIVSTGLLTPITTLFAYAGLLGLTILAFLMRRKAASIFAGWLFFLVAHGIESTFLPLEMYYEHRNYMPSFGLLMCIAGGISIIKKTLPMKYLSQRKIITTLGCAVALMLSFSTFSRVLVWKSENTMVEQGLRHHPRSMRVRLDGMALALREKRYADAAGILQPMINSPDPRQRLLGRINLFAVNCASGGNPKPAQLQLALKDAQPRMTVNEVFTALLLENINRMGKCSNVPPNLLADSMMHMIHAANDQPESAPNKITTRRLASQLYARAGMWKRAEVEARIGWEAYPTLPMGSILVRSYAKNGKLPQARETLKEVEAMVRPSDTQWHEELRQLRQVSSP